MKNLLICLLFVLLGSRPLLSAYTRADIRHENSNIELKERVEADTAKVNTAYRKTGDPKKKKKTTPKAKKVVKATCKRAIVRRGNMGNSGAMRNMYSAKFTRFP